MSEIATRWHRLAPQCVRDCRGAACNPCARVVPREYPKRRSADGRDVPFDTNTLRVPNSHGSLRGNREPRIRHRMKVRPVSRTRPSSRVRPPGMPRTRSFGGGTSSRSAARSPRWSSSGRRWVSMGWPHGLRASRRALEAVEIGVEASLRCARTGRSGVLRSLGVDASTRDGAGPPRSSSSRRSTSGVGRLLEAQVERMPRCAP